MKMLDSVPAAEARAAQRIGEVVDPITFEILSHRLHQITKEMGITLERVGGTVNTTQMHDYIAALYRADGDILCAGEAMPHHVACASYAVKHILRRFGERGEIRPGDMFLLNDPYVAAIHQSDIYVIGPIHHAGRLVAWSATFVHVMDIGAHSPGGNSPGAREIFHEGVRIAGIKLVDRGELRLDVFEAVTNMTRQPEMVALDLRSEIAANNVARGRVSDLCDQYGADVLDAVSAEMLRYSERIYRARLREVPDGTWRAVGSVENDAWTIALALHKAGDGLTFDFTGTAAQAPVGVNLPYHATVGVCYGAVQQALGFDIPKNHGGLAPFAVIAEPGTLVNPTPPAPVSLNTTAGAVVVKYLANLVLSQMLARSERWRSEAMAQYIGSRVFRHAGINQHGGYYISTLRSLAAEGATRDHDGVDSVLNAGWMSCPNVEWVEQNFPLLARYNRHVQDGAGAGMFRGGASGEMAVVIHDAPQEQVKVVAFGMAGLRNAGDGLFGGYPSPPSLLVHVSGGQETLLPYCEIELEHGDVLVMTNGGGGGYGDPLDRDPSLVRADVQHGLVSEVCAAEVYGVVLRPGSVDADATQARRRSLRAARLDGAALPAAPAAAKVGPSQRVGHLRENLVLEERASELWTACERCGTPLCKGHDDWMSAAATRTLLPSTAGALMRVLDDGYRLRQWYCPSCAVLLETQVVPAQ